ncbi:hypothetical protein [Actinoplanes sp. NPDC049265]|uniref:hypothetical protein n=1 Tax=Actinoplanes sp. NPDC049265 TaxID=3363902 RepID=UPI00370FDB03
MSERSSGPAESEPVATAPPGAASVHVEAGQPDPAEAGRSHPTETGQPDPIEAGQSHPIEASRSNRIEASQPDPIEVGDGPFPLTEPAGDDEATLKPKSRTRSILLAGLLAVGVAGAVAAGITAYQIVSEKDATLTPPTDLGGLKVDDSENGRNTSDYLTTALSAEVSLDRTVGAVYRDAADQRKGVLLFGGTGLIWSPGNDLESAFDLIADDQGSVTDVHDVPAGGLGGSMKCGQTITADGQMPVCGWADHGSLAVGLFPSRSEDEAAKLLRDFRDVAQKRN